MPGRLPATLFGGRVRTSTLLLSLLFVGVFALYLEVRPPPTGGASGSNGAGGPKPAGTRSQPASSVTATSTPETAPPSRSTTSTSRAATTRGPAPTSTTPAATGTSAPSPTTVGP